MKTELNRHFSLLFFLFACLFYSQKGDAASKQETLVDRFEVVISQIRTGETLSARTIAAEELATLTSNTDLKQVDDITLGDIASLLNLPDDPVLYWVARSIGNFGERATVYIPTFQKLLLKSDCLFGSKTSASGIRFALTQLGITPGRTKC